MVVSSREVGVRAAPGEMIQASTARVKERDERGERRGGAHAARPRGRLRRRDHAVEGTLDASTIITSSASSSSRTSTAFDDERPRRRRDWQQNAGFFFFFPFLLLVRRSGDVEVVEQRKRVTRSGTRAAAGGECGERRHSRTMRPCEPRRRRS